MSNMSMLVFILISTVLSCTLVYAGDECQDELNEFKKAWQEVVKEGNAPECFQKYELQKYKCSGDEEEDRKKYGALKEYVQSLPTEDQKNIKNCYDETGKMAAEKIGQAMSTECMEELKKYGEKWEEIYKF
ncbi:hypothetical protein TNCT_405341 [Trichonephila clavata]|uniref:Uncharacterized protein n=1 Tax=Trichonephila clavata TaxID=2740835 RepID=A0A8X6KDL8_TRICU|nr:hypothetical protein TNCT_405341 [Trichonephila clavata]